MIFDMMFCDVIKIIGVNLIGDTERKPSYFMGKQTCSSVRLDK